MMPPTTVGIRRPRRSASRPPTMEAGTEGTSSAASIAPATASDAPRTLMKKTGEAMVTV